MISRAELKKLARSRLQDAEVLFNSRRYDGSVYLCGYAVELALKARICRTLKWTHFPVTSAEFREFQSFRTHNLDTLLRLSGIKSNINPVHFADWSVVAVWEPERRYRIAGSTTFAEAQSMIQSTKALLRIIK